MPIHDPIVRPMGPFAYRHEHLAIDVCLLAFAMCDGYGLLSMAVVLLPLAIAIAIASAH